MNDGEEVLCITPYAIARKAKEMDFPFNAARLLRQRVLLYELARWEKLLDSGTDRDWAMPWPYENIDTILDELIALNKYSTDKTSDDTRVTDEEFERANAYPITKVITFNKQGNCICPFHKDTNPSMYHGTKKNIALCPVCNSGWGPVRMLMERDGLTFVKAVRELCSR